jgi:hypothetical protein
MPRWFNEHIPKVHHKLYKNYSSYNITTIVYCTNFKPFGLVYQPLWKRQIAIARNHVRTRYTNNSLIQQPKFMKVLPHIKHHMSSMPQKFHLIWSPRSSVMKNNKFNYHYNPTAQIYFYRESFKLKHAIL